MKKHRVIAGLVATTIVAANMASISANAAGIPGIESDFEYGLTVSAESESQIKLTFFTVCNPGLNALSIAFLYEPDKYEIVNYNLKEDPDANGSITRAIGNNTEKGLFFFTGCFDGNSLNSENDDYFYDFEINLYFEPKDGNVSSDNLSAFSTAIADYKSSSENIDITRLDSNGHYDSSLAPPDEVVIVTPAQSFIYHYMLGDSDGSGSLSVSDSSAIRSLADVSTLTGVTPSINILNKKIEDNDISVISNGNTIAWGSRFSNFMRTVNNVSFPCVECADVNNDNRITRADSDMILDKYAQISSGASVEDVLEIADKTIYY